MRLQAAAESWIPGRMGGAATDVTRLLRLCFGIFVHRFDIIKDKTVLKFSALENLNTTFMVL